MRLRFLMPRFDAQKLQQIAECSDIDWDEISMQMLLEDFRLRDRNLLNKDLTNKKTKRVAKHVPPLSESSEYQSALYLLTVFLCKFEPVKASAILFCFTQLRQSCVRRRVNELCKDFGHY